MVTVGSDHLLDGCSPAVEMFVNVQPIWIPGILSRAIEDNQSATQIDKKSQESSNSIFKDEWLISVEYYVHDTTEAQIHRIPSFLRDEPSNKKCFDPFLVSIGPYHHGNPQLKAFEKLKIPVAQKFVRACFYRVSIQRLYEEVAKVGESARKCYEENSTLEYEDKSFNKMMFLDACFVLHIMDYIVNGTFMVKNDPLMPWTSCLVIAGRDLLLLENQIPLPVLKVLMKFKFENESKGTELIQNFLDWKAPIVLPQESTCTNAVTRFVLRMMGCSDQKKEERKLDMDAPHLLHLVREQLTGSPPQDKNENKSVKCPQNLDRETLNGSSPEDKNENKSVKRLLHLLWEWLIRSSPEDKNTGKLATWTSYRSVKELKSAGIHFRPSQTNHVKDVKFNSHLIYGSLTLPPIMVVDDSTKSSLLNLAAYEMCPCGPSNYHITSYICLMDSLIDHADDVKELRRRRILVNHLGSDEELAQLFNEIAKDLVVDPYAYADVKWQIQNHCKSKARVWMAEWIHNHFSSPWAFLAFLGVIFVIALTVVQTYFTVFPRQNVVHKTS